MGADGHIAYFDAEKVKQIEEEVKAKYPNEADNTYFHGYSCDYLVNGKKVVLSYWGDNASWCGWGAEGSQLSDWWPDGEGQREFAKRITEEAIIVKNQEVWT